MMATISSDLHSNVPNVGKLTSKEQLRKTQLFRLIHSRGGVLLADEADELRLILAKEGKTLITKRVYFNGEDEHE